MTIDPIQKANEVLSSDPFLRAHEFLTKFYDISTGVNPISVRDQMVRAQMLVDRLCRTGVVTRNMRLLVVGGGVAGVTAALWAERLEIFTWLIEEKGEFFSRFDQCTSRRIDPTLYDWPNSCWSKDYYRSDVPLPWTAAAASDLVALWREEEATQAAAARHLTVRKSSVLSGFTPPTNGQYVVSIVPTSGSEEKASSSIKEAHVEPEATLETEAFDAVIFAVGIGKEKTGSGQFHGTEFWADDTFQLPRLGLTSRPSVLIAGAGDGGLQDLIRILTGLHPAEVIQKVNTALTSLDSKAEWQDIQSRILSAQSHAERYYHWGRKGEDPYRVDLAALCEGLDRVFQEQIDWLQEHRLIWQALRTQLLRAEEELPKELALTFPEKVFPWCFALNRFLALLLIECFRDRLPVNVESGTVCPSKRIECRHTAAAPLVPLSHSCHGQDHEVTLVKVLDAFGNPIEMYDQQGRRLKISEIMDSTTIPGQSKHFDVVILRFGLDRDTQDLPPGFAPHQRQILPPHPRAGELVHLVGGPPQ